MNIDEKIREKKNQIIKKTQEIKSLRQDILHLEIMKSEMDIPAKPIFGEEYFVVPKRIVESYLESMFQDRIF